MAGICSVTACIAPSQGLGYCGMHYARFKRNGDPLLTITAPTAAEIRCRACGATDWPPNGHRSTCSQRCAQLYYRNRQAASRVPTAVQCVLCEATIDLFETGKAGRKRRADVKLCDPCRRAKYRRHRMSVSQLARRDGTDCGICGEAVDMALRFPDPRCPSVDHVLPVALGGSHAPENLQLAHLRCNHVKSSRAGFLLTAGLA